MVPTSPILHKMGFVDSQFGTTVDVESEIPTLKGLSCTSDRIYDIMYMKKAQ